MNIQIQGFVKTVKSDVLHAPPPLTPSCHSALPSPKVQSIHGTCTHCCDSLQNHLRLCHSFALQKGESPLYIVTKNEHLDAVKTLLEAGANVKVGNL